MRRLTVLAALLSFLLVVPAARAADDIVLLRHPDRSVATETAQRERALGFEAEHRYDRAIDGFAADLTAGQADALRADPEVAAVVPNRPVHALGVVPAVSPSRVPPGVHRVTETDASSVRQAADGAVAVIDTGVDLTHPDLNVVAGTNCITPGADPVDDNGHGTHVAGTIAARNDAQGVTGVAPGTQIVAVKVLDATGAGDTASILCGVEWVLNHAAERHITVANFSLGGSGPASSCASDPEHAVFCSLASAGITPVGAAGNDGSDFGATHDIPASFPQVLTVAATVDTDGRPGGFGPAPTCGSDGDDHAASYSNFATTAADAAHLVAAPGTCIRSTYFGGRYAIMSGTSMASPHVAGLVALCKSEAGTPGPCAGLTTPQIISRMRVTNEWTAFTGVAGSEFGPLAVLSDPNVPTPPVSPLLTTDASPRSAGTGAAATGSAPAAAPAPAPVPAPEPPEPAPAPAPAPPVDAPALALAVRAPQAARLATLRRRGLTVRLQCSTSCAGTLRLRARGTTLAALHFARGGTVRLRLTRTGRRRLARMTRPLHATLTAQTTRRAARVTRRVTIRP